MAAFAEHFRDETLPQQRNDRRQRSPHRGIFRDREHRMDPCGRLPFPGRLISCKVRNGPLHNPTGQETLLQPLQQPRYGHACGVYQGVGGEQVNKMKITENSANHSLNLSAAQLRIFMTFNCFCCWSTPEEYSYMHICSDASCHGGDTTGIREALSTTEVDIQSQTVMINKSEIVHMKERKHPGCHLRQRPPTGLEGGGERKASFGKLWTMSCNGSQ